MTKEQINELYASRKAYNVCLFNEWTAQGKYNVHKSRRHFDGEMAFEGEWFIVVAELPTGQITNHYEMEDWHLFECPERETSPEWDGHTTKHVIERLLTLKDNDSNDMIKEFATALTRSREKHGNEPFHSVHEAIGICWEELYEVTMEAHAGNKRKAAQELLDLSIAGFWGYRSFSK
jgi:hypothetical protein